MTNRAHSERGVALMVSILALVVMGGLVTAAFTTTWLDFRLADNTRRATQAFGAADFGLATTTGSWNRSWNSLDVLDSAAVSGSLPHGSGSYTGYVKRVATDMYLVEIVGVDKSGRSQQHVGEFMRLAGLQVDIQAAMTIQGPTTIGGSAEIVGADSVPSGWSSCPTPDPSMDQSGIRMPSTSALNTQGGCSGATCITGSPAVEEDPSVNDDTFSVFGDLDWDELVQQADPLSPGTYSGIGPVLDGSGVCDKSVANNWGDPLNQASDCADHQRLMYTAGNLKLTGNYGQGMLLVEGDLSVSGGFEFYGVVIVRGTLTTTGTGGHFNGAVMAQNVNLDDNKVLGNALVQYSSCATTRALKAAAPATRLPSRGWIYTN